MRQSAKHWSLFSFIGVAVIAGAFVVIEHDHQIPVVLYKASLLTIGAFLAFLLDHAFFKLGNLDSGKVTEQVRIALIQRRGLLVAAGMVAMAMAL